MQVLITFAEKPIANYPLAVVVVFDDGKRSQETVVPSIREARIFGNGLCAGLRLAANGDHYPVNPEVDHRLIDVPA